MEVPVGAERVQILRRERGLTWWWASTNGAGDTGIAQCTLEFFRSPSELCVMTLSSFLGSTLPFPFLGPSGVDFAQCRTQHLGKILSTWQTAPSAALR